MPSSTNILCASMQKRARRRIPGMTQLLSKRPDMFSLGVWPGYYESAAGAHVRDLDGNRYLDMSISGIGACVLGYADPDVDNAVLHAVSKGVASSLNCPEEVLLAEELCMLHPWAEMVRLARTGAEAMAIAVRLARAATGRDIIAFCGYHGWHDWYLAANLGDGNALSGHLLPGLDPSGVPSCLAGTALPFRYNKPEELREILQANRGKIAAVVMEPVRGHMPAPGFLERVRELADQAGAVLVFDEISAGLRLTTGGAHMALGPVRPDLAVFSKALGNGYAIAAVIGTKPVMEFCQKSFISSTMFTERVGPAAALAVLRKHGELDVATHLQAVGSAVLEGWRDLGTAHGLPIETGGIAPLAHFSFGGQAPLTLKALFVQLMLEHNILASTLFYAMFSHTLEHVRIYLDAADKAFRVLARAEEEGRAHEMLQGEPAGAGFARLA
jgi:glutamate-1-semialdehyde 2,1-aminomutase